jgi:2-polyprenyl-6-methoxyphenol hydroxylase-like FAD-dependent oxidoreductase
MDSHFLAGKNIIVAGAGISGLSFTLALRRLWPANLTPPSITIYERDSNVVPAGREGYTISLAGHDETGGLYAARDLGILDDVMNHAVQSFGNKFEFTMWNSSWSELLTQKYEPAPGLPASGIRIARKKLRQVLTDVVGRERVIWNTTCVDAERLHNGKMLIKLLGSHLSENESTAECDLLIIADGASSKLRASLRPNDTLQYTGIMQKGGLAIFPNGIPKPVDEKWGLILSPGKGVACFLSPYDETSVSWGLSYRAPTIEEPLRISSIEEAQTVIDECKELGKEFLEPFQSILDATDPKSVSRLAARDKQPFSHDLSLGPAIFIGDSNHAITPFSGYGASLAMKDGWDLATQLCGSQGLEEAVKAYDAISIPRATKMLKESRQRIDMSHATALNTL